MADLQNTVTTATAPYVAPDAAPDTVQWAAAVAAQNLRDSARLFADCLTDLGRVS
ncbi:MAG: hypothetical protein ACTIIQ_08760 [Corynebacterium variabile]|uniref:hypothetical protein n=1 Tax=Corynebacterium variabile TaxID=1727 RepID=UPI003F999A2B